ncbi:MAG: UDP-N-acetylmuramate dehydrogenase [Thermodesulfovibrio sp.]|nr:UDP-N-acetylmuramate dehydrogenase [Thermodesulfovibrio sp.]
MPKIETFCKEKGILYKKNESLAQYTTLRIGGEAAMIVFPREEHIRELLEVIKNEGLSYYMVGGGSNLLVSDRGFKGVIVNTKKMDTIRLERYTLKVGAGVMLGRVLAFLGKRGLSGMEGLIGIPGTVGGAVFCNAGSFGYEIKDCLEEIELIDEALNIKNLKKSEINFRYRSSGLSESVIIKTVKFVLKEEREDIFGKMKEFLIKKRESQPIKDHSAGCVFKNPDGTSAGFLIDKAGLKGTRVGDIIVSKMHANYFINIGKGKASDFLKLMDMVKERVFKIFSVELRPEIRFLEA